MAGEFRGARLKLRRANKHISETKRLVAEFVEANKGRVIREFKDGVTEFSYDPTQNPIDFNIALAFGDAIHNLKAAFDHVFFTLVSKLSADAVPKNIQLPIRENRQNTEATMKDTKTPTGRAFTSTPLGELLREAVADFVYQGNAGNNPFLMLHALDNIDKHRLLITVAKVGGVGVESMGIPGQPPCFPELQSSAPTMILIFVPSNGKEKSAAR